MISQRGTGGRTLTASLDVADRAPPGGTDEHIGALGYALVAVRPEIRAAHLRAACVDLFAVAACSRPHRQHVMQEPDCTLLGD